LFNVYDNGGATIDRYTICIYREPFGENIFIITDGRPDSKNGIWQKSNLDSQHEGIDEKKIDVMELPAPARKKLLQELQLDK